MGSEKKGWDYSQLRKYDISLEQIPRLDYQDPKVDELMAENEPVVITGSKLVKSAEKWNLDYLEKHMGNGDFTVFISRNYKFKYYDEKKILQKLPNNETNRGVEFTPPTKMVEMKLPEFIKRLKEWKRGDERLYLQQGLNDTVGPAIVRDFLKFDWDFCNSIQKKQNWGPLTSNHLLIGMEGNVTPCHYDEQQNLFAQVQGYKRCILFSPDQFDRLYPHPVYHPHDRQSMVDFERPDYSKFPKFKDIKGCETVMEPGDVLYIPIYWWHQVESLMRGDHTITINFWYKNGPTGPITYPLKSHHKVAVMRNVEKMLLEVLHDPKEIPPLMRALVLGRYTE
ncbi:hypoxia-inducible factor 1-alpha inhibitor isoform X3 [Agrilus planipennis]|uniref:Hypoxia-inducible factor 1-alpha inhibitor isoform X3 n=1 Tax=Agrilus planipennis TaxID=224129 RepID=A0A1W4WKK4_AGRPL|nr:hypoxia-inducible factor 1-alpha inhibitor isoform X3 [Agrilus planipennis]